MVRFHPVSKKKRRRRQKIRQEKKLIKKKVILIRREIKREKKTILRNTRKQNIFSTNVLFRRCHVSSDVIFLWLVVHSCVYFLFHFISILNRLVK